ncbi:MAG: N-formylglutamate amidohydrolase [Alphaproteobacteria bacterium]|nr:MAG: N-formylglutamate amidohydrolase [Alphaproteobacteria bacterium]
MQTEAFTLALPRRRTSGAVFASPHSGCRYGADFLRRCLPGPLAMRSSEDAFVDALFADAPEHGAPLIAAVMPRAYVDLNRGADELDPALIRGLGKRAGNPRVAAGLGVIPRVVAGGRMIYGGKISLAEAETRIDRYWRPYHARLAALLDEARRDFGQAILFDCHSMPHEAIETLVPTGKPRPEIVIGDRFGTSASGEIVSRVEDMFRAAGLRVARNAPFAGAYSCKAYGRPARGFHAVQIEIDRALYMNEETLERRDDFDAFRRLVGGIVAELAALGRQSGEHDMAAE